MGNGPRPERRVAARRVVKALCVGLVVIAAAWSLRSPEEKPEREGERQHPHPTRYSIKFFPGAQYMPGTIPYGIGRPLHGVSDVIRDFEKLYPDTKVEIVSAPSSVREYLVTQLSTGQAPDIIMVTVEDVWPDIQKGWYVPLDSFLDAPNAFVRSQGNSAQPGYERWWDLFRYQAISRAKAAPDGQYYTISFDMVETGIFYNKTLFQKAGVTAPRTWEEFMRVLSVLRGYRTEDGGTITPLLIHLDNFNAWATDLLFDQLYYDAMPGLDLIKDPVRGRYIRAYLDWDELTFLHGKGFFTRRDPRYVQIWPIMHKLAGYCNRNLLASVSRDFVTGRGAMLWDVSAFTYQLTADPDIHFEWGVFYLPPLSKAESEFAPGQPMCVVGGPATSYAITNSAIRDTDEGLSFQKRLDSSERLKRVVAFLQFLTLPDNYARVVNEYPSFIPNIVGVPVLEPLKPFEETLNGRYTTTKWIYTFDLKFSEVQRRMLQLYLSDGISLDEFLDRWQLPSVSDACARAQRRMSYDERELELAWERLAPLREGVKGLPQ